MLLGKAHILRKKEIEDTSQRTRREGRAEVHHHIQLRKEKEKSFDIYRRRVNQFLV